MRKLVNVQVTKLLGQFDHNLEFPADWDFVIIHGPNGVGKTKFLELIRAAINLDNVTISRIPFESLRISFEGGAELLVQMIDSVWNDDVQRKLKVKLGVFTLSFPGEEHLRWAAYDERDMWQHWKGDLHTLNVFRDITYPEVESAHNLDSQAPSDAEVARTDRDYIRKSFGDILKTPREALDFLSTVYVHLIETQRLLIDPPTSSGKNTVYSISWRGLDGPETSTETSSSNESKPTVLRYAEDLSQRLRDAMTENSRVSQKLDRNFPRRVLDLARQIDPETEQSIRSRYNGQNELRTELAEIAVLDAAPEMNLPDRELDAWERKFLGQYLDDTDEKLASFKWLLDRTRLFRDIINSRFLFKKVVIDRERGFKFITDTGHDISPTQLSSGEQHELVLTYGLLFNVQRGSLVLIDEPEISLHVTWQQDFINDIRKISEVADLRFIVATHSPQIIHHWWSRAVALAPLEGEGAWA